MQMHDRRPRELSIHHEVQAPSAMSHHPRAGSLLLSCRRSYNVVLASSIQTKISGEEIGIKFTRKEVLKHTSAFRHKSDAVGQVEYPPSLQHAPLSSKPILSVSFFFLTTCFQPLRAGIPT